MLLMVVCLHTMQKNDNAMRCNVRVPACVGVDVA